MPSVYGQQPARAPCSAQASICPNSIPLVYKTYQKGHSAQGSRGEQRRQAAIWRILCREAFSVPRWTTVSTGVQSTSTSTLKAMYDQPLAAFLGSAARHTLQDIISPPPSHHQRHGLSAGVVHRTLEMKLTWSGAVIVFFPLYFPGLVVSTLPKQQQQKTTLQQHRLTPLPCATSTPQWR